MIYLDLFWTFFKIGLFTFGGGYAMLPLIQEELLAHGWATLSQLIDFIAVSESTPGPFAVNISTYIGMEMAELAGAACATLGVILPSFAIILLVARGFQKFRENQIVRGCLRGLKGAVPGLIAAAVLSVGQTVFFPGGVSLAAMSGLSFYVSLGVFLLAAYLVFRKKLHPIWVICLSAGLGVLAGYTLPLGL